MFKQVIPECKHSNITPHYINCMYEEEDGKENQEIEYILSKYIMNNKVKQLFITKKQKVPSALNIEIQELYDVLMKDNVFKKFDIKAETFIDFMYQQTIKDNKSIDGYEDKVKQDIKYKYKRYKDIEKYAGELPKSNMEYYENGSKVKSPLDKFAYFMSAKKGAKVFSYYHRLNEWGWLDAPVYKEQFKQYKKQIKNKTIVIDEENNDEHLLNGIKWYSVCFQKWDKEEDDYGEMNLCKGSLDVFGDMISGYVYYFEKKADRDNAYNWLVK
tara:strand:+ start:1817 stop:2629 length:813 start_codon:yes stop_codon:yes gene_type:complete